MRALWSLVFLSALQTVVGLRVSIAYGGGAAWRLGTFPGGLGGTNTLPFTGVSMANPPAPTIDNITGEKPVQLTGILNPSELSAFHDQHIVDRALGVDSHHKIQRIPQLIWVGLARMAHLLGMVPTATSRSTDYTKN